MKLYANVSSERATKGQGGNDRLYTEVSFEKRKIAGIYLNKSNTPGNDTYIFSVKIWGDTGIKQFDYTLHSTEETKGKSQKGENKLCKQCRLNPKYNKIYKDIGCEHNMSLGEGLNHFSAETLTDY